jgi:hypothetical protein
MSKPNDAPRWEDAKAIEAERENDRLKAGDVIQKWIPHQDKTYRVEWRWRDGDVLAVVEKPYSNMPWVALIQWRDGNEVKGWDALTQVQWTSVMFRRKP